MADGMHSEDIKAALRKRYGAITKLAQAWGYNRAAISHVIKRGDISVRVERRIADALDMPPFKIWPDRWSPDGEPLPRTGPKSSRFSLPQTAQKERAA